MRTITTNCLFILLLVSQLPIYAQITIGSTQPPVEGALLDLKTGADGKSNKGLLLPRVMLEEPDELKPMYSYKEEDTPTPAELLSHTGLLVYNLTKQQKDPCDFTVGKLQEGVFLWDGKEWIDISNPEGNDINMDRLQLSVRSKDVKIFYDTRDPDNPEPYACRRFGEPDEPGTKAGIWMTTNLRATMFDPDYMPAWPVNKIKEGGKTEQSQDGFFYMCPYPYYQKVKGEDGKDKNVPNVGYNDYWTKKNPIAGLMYNYKCIMAGKSGTQVQGLCPKGWHVPSLSEYKTLKTAIYEHPERYLIEYDNGGGYPKGKDENFTNAFIVPCTPFETVGDKGNGGIEYNKTIIGRSKSYSDGGFGDFGVGVTMMTTKPKAYSKNTHTLPYNNLTSKNELGSDRPLHLNLSLTPSNKIEEKETAYSEPGVTNAMPLRCKKDNNDFDFE